MARVGAMGRENQFGKRCRRDNCVCSAGRFLDWFLVEFAAFISSAESMLSLSE
jgi:hypothetical protein